MSNFENITTALHHHPWLRWSVSSAFFKTRGPQIVSLIPTIGYVLLWSDALQPVFSYTQKLGARGILAPTTRLYLLYFGSLFVLAAWLMFLAKCPRFIRRHPDKESFVHETISAGDATHLSITEKILIDLIDKKNASSFSS